VTESVEKNRATWVPKAVESSPRGAANTFVVRSAVSAFHADTRMRLDLTLVA
jgi:hypothetical protein